MRKTKLIVLRGPSGSGKSTTAKTLFTKAKHRIALIDQDHYRFIFKPAGGGSKPNADTIHQMIKSDVLIALNSGYDVILEGILSVRSYGELLDEIFAQHQGENYMYYFDISFDETVRRHAMRKTESMKFTDADMREWFPAAHRSSHKLEQIIPEYFSAQETVDYIVHTSKLAVAKD